MTATTEIQPDAANDKRTLAVRFGEQAARVQIACAHALAVAVPFVAYIFGVPRGAIAASLLALLLAPVSLTILMGRDGVALNRNLAGFGAMLYLYGLVFAAGILVSGGAR